MRLFFVIAFALNAVGLLVEAFCRWVLHSPWPYRSPLLMDAFGGDLLTFRSRWPFLHHAAFFSRDLRLGSPFTYPAPIAPVCDFFYQFHNPPLAFITTALLIAALGIVCFAFAIRRHTHLGIASSLAIGAAACGLSFPLAFELKQFNTEIVVCAVVAAGIWFFLRHRFHTAAAFFGIAASMKIFPFVFVALFISRRRLWPIVTTALFALLSTLLSLRYIEPSILHAWKGINENIAQLQNTVMLGYMPEMGFDHSLFALIKTGLLPLKLDIEQLRTLLRVYMFCCAMGGIALYFLRLRFLPILNQILCLYIVAVLLPPSSYDYTLLHLYVPWALLVLFAYRHSKEQVAGLNAAFVCLAILTSIQTELIVRLQSNTPHVIEGQIKTLALVALFLIALRHPFASASFKPTREQGGSSPRQADPTALTFMADHGSGI